MNELLMSGGEDAARATQMSPTDDQDNAEQDQPSRASAWLSRLEVADALFVLIIVAAAVMRLVELGQLPLSPDEAETALAVWKLWQPGESVATLGSPAYFTLSSLLSQLLGFSDAVMRLIPALFGLALIALPWLLREQLGRLAALSFSLFLAVSPLNSAVSRTAGGDAIALFAVLLIFISWIRYRESSESRWLYALGVALGLGLSSSALFYGGLVSLAAAVLLHRAMGSEAQIGAEESLPDRRLLRQTALIAATVFVATSTMFLWYPGGLGAAAELPATWLAQFNFRGGLSNLLNPLLATGRYEILLIIPGLATFIWATREESPLTRLALWWILPIALLTLVQWGQMDYAVLLTLPGYLLLAQFGNDLLKPRVESAGWSLGGLILLAGMLIFANLARYGRISVFEPQQLGNVWISFIVFALALAGVYLVLTWQPEAAYQGILVGVVMLMLFYQWGTSWWLSHAAANDPRERWVLVGTDDDVRLLAEVARDISLQTTGSDVELDIVSTTDSPILGWYLRDFRRLTATAERAVGAGNDVIISPVEAELALGSDYLGADFGLIRSAPQPEATSQGLLLDTLRWWLFHETRRQVNEERVVLWWRADLIGELN